MNAIDYQTIVTAFHQMSGWEIAAAMMGVAYILLAAKTSQWCWLFAFLSTLVYTALFWEGQLPMQALLNFYYMGMAIYGFWLWQQHGKQTETLRISRWPWLWHVGFIAVGIVVSALVTAYLQKTGQSQSPMLDAYTTVFSVMNTWLIARKILENWLYWVVVDGAATLLYVQTGYYATAVLFVLNTILALVGFISWVKLYRQQTMSMDNLVMQKG
ncbi:nicotinamide riboside transporter PnuC [Methylophilus medardicus]|uniref:Nicotinamide riboside transporter PnuC n=1 Tax=Methylophilus medardicus TaxID=2588534 RepID=A0A5B8CRK3_9PROT|nr:nicotinamide riboside transporter PnuC [Methylophilus medardicus]QDC43908.1 nicotinamide mononucleotide transporter [Methylophilus medardicus]QDC48915.1 nicotinamide mononucleotide transporter [Methylophilus medardicus]QDC52620.1 nicotinamide mononucleotide transporter [Methylophilus medardicus]